MTSGWRFQFRPVLTAFAVLALGILIALGNWQLKRLEWKRDLIAQTESLTKAAPIAFSSAVRAAKSGAKNEYAAVEATGVFDPDGEERVFGAIEGRAGVFIFTPMKLAGGTAVYVNRGFVPQELERISAYAPPPAGVQSIRGLLRYAEHPRPPASWVVSLDKGGDGVWQVRDPARFARAHGVEAAPYYIDAFAAAGEEWPRGGTTRLNFTNRHLEYALTWFGLGAALAGVWLAASLKKNK